MKKLFTLVALTLVAAVSISVSAQSSKFVGKWNASTGSQAAMLEAMGADLENAVTTMTFNNDGTYVTYSYVKAKVNIMGVTMYMLSEINDKGTWRYSNEQLCITSKSLEFVQFDISFDDASLNAMKGEIEDGMVEMMNGGVGFEVPYDVEFVSNNKVIISFENELLPIEFVLTR